MVRARIMKDKYLHLGLPDQTRRSPLKSGLAKPFLVLRRSGDLSEEPEPDPISNSAVKLLSADGTVSQDPGE